MYCSCFFFSISSPFISFFFFFFFNDTATTEIYTLSLHDALPIYRLRKNSIPKAGAVRRLLPVWLCAFHWLWPDHHAPARKRVSTSGGSVVRSEEHTSELQSHLNLVCRLLLEKKKKKIIYIIRHVH